MDEIARERDANLENVRQLANQRRLKVIALKQQTGKDLQEFTSKEEEAAAIRIQKEGLDRELNCLMFEWESIPNLMEEKGRLYLAEAQRLAELNDEMTRELARRGIPIPVEQGDDNHDGDKLDGTLETPSDLPPPKW